MFAGRMIQAQDSSARKSGVLLARRVLSIAARVELKWSKSNLKMLCALRMTRAPAQSRTSRRRQSFVFQIPREAHLFLPARGGRPASSNSRRCPPPGTFPCKARESVQSHSEGGIQLATDLHIHREQARSKRTPGSYPK